MQLSAVRGGVARQNKLLAALPEADWRRVSPALQLISMPVGMILYESGVPLEHLYFPTSAVVGLLYQTVDGASDQVAVVGNDGAVGIALFMSDGATPGRGVVQIEGLGYRLRAEFLKIEFSRGGALQRVLLRYADTLVRQIGQAVACNRHHSIEQQLCRWLLTIDQYAGDGLAITQERIANLLGVRREGVAQAARRLQQAGLVAHSRGRITLVDRDGLEARCCECYSAAKRVLNHVRRAAGATRHLQASGGVFGPPGQLTVEAIGAPHHCPPSSARSGAPRAHRLRPVVRRASADRL